MAGAGILAATVPEFTSSPLYSSIARMLFGVGIAIAANIVTGTLSVGRIRASPVIRPAIVLIAFLLGFMIAPIVFERVAPLTVHEASFSSTTEPSHDPQLGQLLAGLASASRQTTRGLRPPLALDSGPGPATAPQPASGDCPPAGNGASGAGTPCGPPATPEQSLSAIDAALGKLLSGNIAFNAPDRATLAKSVVIEARLSATESPSVLAAELTGPGVANTASIRVGDKMAATLIGGDAFAVSPAGPQVQLISHKDTTIWTWDITPKQSGKRDLVLSIDAILTIDGKEGNRTENTLRRSIDVEVGWPETASEWIGYIKTMFEGLSWIWATILVPVTAYLVRLWARRRAR